jgi:thiol-disulfide isomerase/thioredoxin
MKKTYLIAAVLLSQFALSQIWVNSFEDAKKMAKATNKFILVDFNATWCKPCKMMESEFFKNPKYKENLDKFIAVSVDIDAERGLASEYGVSSIPNVKVMDITGDVIHEVLGYEGATSSDKEFEGFPNNAENLYESLVFADKKNPTAEELLNLGTSYQLLVQKSQNRAKQKFASLSSNTFTKCAKKTKDNNIKEVAELGKFFNQALTNSGSKVIKNLDVAKISEPNRSYAYYILAKSNYEEKHKDEGDKMVMEIEKINDQQWVPAATALKTKFAKQ